MAVQSDAAPPVMMSVGLNRCQDVVSVTAILATSAEIKECCRKAYRLKISLTESAQYIVPISRSAAEQIKTLRSQDLREVH